jgi:hypothetical protein
MSHIAKLLELLDAAARSRVLGWAISALDVQGLVRAGDSPDGRRIAGPSVFAVGRAGGGA